MFAGEDASPPHPSRAQTGDARITGIVQYVPLAVGFTVSPEKLDRLLSQRSRWARGMLEGLHRHPPPKQPRVRRERRGRWSRLRRYETLAREAVEPDRAVAVKDLPHHAPVLRFERRC